MSVRLILVFTCALSLLLAACAPNLEHMASADLVTAASAEYRPGPAIIAEQVAWGAPTVVRGDVIGTIDESEGPYILDTGDRLRIFVYGQPNLSRLYVSLPFAWTSFQKIRQPKVSSKPCALKAI